MAEKEESEADVQFIEEGGREDPLQQVFKHQH